MVVVLDTSVLIAHERGVLSVADKLADHDNSRGVISAVTVSELLHGVHRADRQAICETRRLAVEGFIAQFQVVVFDTKVARTHARLHAELASRGTPIGAYDLMIAASAMTLGAPVATSNEKDFPRVPALDVLRW